MARPARKQLAQLLDDAEPAGSYSAELLAPAHSLRIEVADLGPVPLPLRAPQARKLISVARPAMFGRGEETLSDSTVRDTWEITPDQLTLGGTDWSSILGEALDELRQKLGLPPAMSLRAEPHSLLVYGKGQFFLPHQDSEKDDTMLGTLVVSLPSAHTGGELVIHHGGDRRTHHASRTELSLVAFYADCRHEVTPVRSGYRVTLTFNLLAHDPPSTNGSGPVADLTRCLTEHFTTPATSQYESRPLDPPNRLVYLLDHDYTQRGLCWDRLKGPDRNRAALLRAAAEQAGCEAVLALADVQETWGAYPVGDAAWDDDHWYDEEDEEGEADEDGGGTDADGDYELSELIDDDITLTWLTRPDGTQGDVISLHVPEYEVSATTPNAHLEPYEASYEGYMGNYGNTLDRWYHRGAVVLWPQQRDRAFAARAEARPRHALDELRALIEADDTTRAGAAAKSLAPFWRTAVAGDTETQADLLESALAVAAGLDSAATAAMLLAPFRLETLAPRHADGLAAAAHRHGDTWAQSLIAAWFGPERPGKTDWTCTLPELCRALRAAGATSAARALLDGAWSLVRADLHDGVELPRAEIRRPRLRKLGSPLTWLLQAADDALRQIIQRTLRECGDNVLECLMPALRSPDAQRTAGFGVIARDCAERLAAIVARTPRDPDDWSMTWSGCGCDLCDVLGAFLTSRSRRIHEWPLAKAGRRHVHTRIDTAALPVRHETRRQGRPYTLVLTKTSELFTREQDIQSTAQSDLTWLKSAWRTS
ncbi:2OG-Fe(II) oxygenase [Streptomyces cadmiisoli]|uniref:2OG-Fe(II) oxygenase n=1 Tax=Streptomyces cadmiisoli TaxID=2184053 RepID=UPI00365AE188